MKLLSFIRSLIFLLLVVSMPAGSCRKTFLAQKPSTDLLVPNSLNVLQELLDNTQVMNISPALGEVSADNYFLFRTLGFDWIPKNTMPISGRRIFMKGRGWFRIGIFHISKYFMPIRYCKGWRGSSRIRQIGRNGICWRAGRFLAGLLPFTISHNFLPNPMTPLRRQPIWVFPSGLVRISMKRRRGRACRPAICQILSDLNMAEELLPAAIPVSNLNRPSKLAAQALFARIYLSVGDYVDAGKYADSVLEAYSYLLDYNNPGIGGPIPFQKNMPEVLYQSNFAQPGNGNVLEGLICTGCIVDTNLRSLLMIQQNDLRRPVYLFLKRGRRDSFTLTGGYSGSIFPFTGLATDELYLIRAECSARATQTTSALNDLDSLLTHRWKTSTFTPYPITNADVATGHDAGGAAKGACLPGSSLVRSASTEQSSLVYQPDPTYLRSYLFAVAN